MRRIQSFIASLCVALLLSPLALAQDVPPPSQSPQKTGGSTQSVPMPKIDKPGYEPLALRSSPRWFDFRHNYKAVDIPQINMSNTDRLDRLMRSGNIYLSLQDAIALALENNLDVQNQRFGAAIAQANLLRSQAGGALRGVTPGVQNGPSSASAGQQTGVSQSASSLASNAGSNATGALVQQTGSIIPNLDPTIQGVLRFGHNSTPQYNAVVAGTSSQVVGTKTGQIQLTEGFLTGTTYSLGYSDVVRSTNSYSDLFNPARTGSFTFQLTQNLLQGFGRSVNNRYIIVARNNIEGADLSFKQQVIATVADVQNLYWDLVAFYDDVRAKEQALATNQKLYEDNKKQVEIGTLAPIAVVQAEAAVASSQQDLILSQTRVLQQETIIKNYLSRNGIAAPAVLEAHVIPTDHIAIPTVEAVQPIQDLIAQALTSRPELASSRINVTNSRINLKGSRSELLPTLQAFVNLANNGLAGNNNTLTVPIGENGNPSYVRPPGNPYFVGGYGTLLGQLFGRNFPDYAAGLQLNIPLRNRTAQADYALDQISLRQSEIALRKQENQIRVDVQNAVIGLQQSRAVFQSAQKARTLQEQTLDAEQKKLALGASTIYNVILIQRDLANAQSAQVTASANYSKARVELERATGQILTNHNVSVQEAYRGQIARPPDPLPPPSQQP